MKVKVEFTAVLHIPHIQSGAWVDIEPSSTVSSLLKQLGLSPRHIRYVAAAVNGQHVRTSHRLNDGDTVWLSLPIGGG